MGCHQNLHKRNILKSRIDHGFIFRSNTKILLLHTLIKIALNKGLKKIVMGKEETKYWFL